MAQDKYQCTKKKCGWIGTDAEKVEIPIKLAEPKSICADIAGLTTLCCPQCGNHEFYTVKEKKVKI